MNKKILGIGTGIIILMILGGIAFCYSSNNLEKGVTMGGINKPIEEYTFDEFNSLTGEEQMNFQNEFESIDAFDEWLNEVNPKENEDVLLEEDIPWMNGGKKPEEYTWEEFNDLSGALQIKFQSAFENENGFDNWLNENEPKNN